jgi:predicted DNA-binding transcriptional regulator AlpA
MTLSDGPFILPDELDQRTPFSDTTRWRQEKAGRFPRRIKIGVRKIAYRRSDIEAWESDPEGWAARNQAR